MSASSLRVVPWLVALLLTAAVAAADESPWSSAVQVDAPSVSSASPDLLDHAMFPARAGFAWDDRLASMVNRHAMTLSVTPDPWQRAALRVTVGGPLQFVDSLRAGEGGRALDHVTSELKLRLLEDRSTVLALALGADNVGTGFGLDRYGATVIAERQGPCLTTANVGYRILERYHELHRKTETKLGLGTDWRLGPEWRRGAFDFGVSGACLLRNRGRSAIWQGGAVADVRVADGLRVALAERRSDREEIRGDGRTREVLSLSYAF